MVMKPIFFICRRLPWNLESFCLWVWVVYQYILGFLSLPAPYEVHTQWKHPEIIQKIIVFRGAGNIPNTRKYLVAEHIVKLLKDDKLWQKPLIRKGRDFSSNWNEMSRCIE
jgi:hypothetical protein